MADDIRILQLINTKALNRIDEQFIEISPPVEIPNVTEVSGVVSNTEITIKARPEGRYKNSKTVRYRRNTLQAEFDGYPDINPTGARPVWKNIIYSEMVDLVSSILGMFCIMPTDVEMESFDHLFPPDSRGRKQLDLTQVVDGKLTVVIRPTFGNYYYNGPVTVVFDVVDESYSYLDQ